MPERSSVQVMMSSPAAFAFLGVLRRHDRCRASSASSAKIGGADDVDALRACSPRARRTLGRSATHIGVVEIDGLFAERRLVIDPVEHVVLVERLRPTHAFGDTPAALYSSIIFCAYASCVKPSNGIVTLGTLELRRHLHAEPLEQLDALLVRQQMAAASGRSRGRCGSSACRPGTR